MLASSRSVAPLKSTGLSKAASIGRGDSLASDLIAGTWLNFCQAIQTWLLDRALVDSFCHLRVTSFVSRFETGKWNWKRKLEIGKSKLETRNATFKSGDSEAAAGDWRFESQEVGMPAGKVALAGGEQAGLRLRALELRIQAPDLHLRTRRDPVSSFQFPISSFQFLVFRLHASQRNGGTTDKKGGEALPRDSLHLPLCAKPPEGNVFRPSRFEVPG
jgi:hypothetical protein